MNGVDAATSRGAPLREALERVDPERYYFGMDPGATGAGRRRASCPMLTREERGRLVAKEMFSAWRRCEVKLDPSTRAPRSGVARVVVPGPRKAWRFRGLAGRRPHAPRPTRREFLLGTGSLLLLAPYGCGEGREGEATAGGTRTVRHAMGVTQVPAKPGRIVAVTGQMDLDALLALGLQPVAAGANFEDDTAVNPWSEEKLEDGVEVFRFRPEIDVEQVATFEPDLILGHVGWMEPVYDQLSQVAPTVVVPYDGGVEGPAAMWREPMRIVARAVGREERGEEVLSGIDRRIEGARKRLSGLGDLTVSIFAAGEGYQAFYNRLSYPGYLVEQVGLSRPRAQREVRRGADDPTAVEFSNERLDLLDADVVFGLSFDSDEFMDEFESQPLFQNLDAVKSGNYVRIFGEEYNYWYYPTVFTPPLMLDSLLGHLEELGFLEGR